MEASPSHQQIVNGTTPPLELVNKTQISFTDETTSDPEVQTDWDGETTLFHGESSDESSTESSTNPIHVRSTIAKSRCSANPHPIISVIDEEAAGYYSRPKKQQHLRSQSNSPIGNKSTTLTSTGTSINSSASSVNSYYFIEDRSYIREKRFLYSECLNLPSNQIYATVGVINDWYWKFAVLVFKDWTLEQLINRIKPELRDHQNVKKLLYENYDLDIFVPINNDEDFKECLQVSKVILNIMVVDGGNLLGK